MDIWHLGRYQCLTTTLHQPKIQRGQDGDLALALGQLGAISHAEVWQEEADMQSNSVWQNYYYINNCNFPS